MWLREDGFWTYFTGEDHWYETDNSQPIRSIEITKASRLDKQLAWVDGDGDAHYVEDSIYVIQLKGDHQALCRLLASVIGLSNPQEMVEGNKFVFSVRQSDREKLWSFLTSLQKEAQLDDRTAVEICDALSISTDLKRQLLPTMNHEDSSCLQFLWELMTPPWQDKFEASEKPKRDEPKPVDGLKMV